MSWLMMVVVVSYLMVEHVGVFYSFKDIDFSLASSFSA